MQTVVLAFFCIKKKTGICSSNLRVLFHKYIKTSIIIFFILKSGLNISDFGRFKIQISQTQKAQSIDLKKDFRVHLKVNPFM